MTWFKVDDSFYDHPKVFDAPDCALALWVRAGCWSARNLTDGFVPANLPARLCDDPDTAVRELVARGLWTRTKGGHIFHDWTEYQPTGDEVRDLRQKRAEAGRKGGQAKAAQQTASKRQASASGVAKQNAAPSRPVPTRPKSSSTAVGDSSSVVDVGAENDDDLDKINEVVEGRIIELLYEGTSRTVDRAWASKIRRQILDGRDTRNPLNYVASAIRGEPHKYLPATGAPYDQPPPPLRDVPEDVAHSGADLARELLAAKRREEAAT